jgi:hypothetical protein
VASLVLDYFKKTAADRPQKPAAVPKDPTRPAEKILLNLLLSNADARERLVPELQPLAAVQQFATARIFATIFALHTAGERVAFDAVHARLEENDRELLAAAVMTGEAGEEVFSLEQGEECLRTLQRADAHADIAAVKARIRECERTGDIVGAMRLFEDLRRMERAAQ